MINKRHSQTQIISKPLPCPSHLFVYPHSLLLTPSHILFFDFIDQIKQLHAVCRKTGKHISSFAGIGAEAGESRNSTCPFLTNQGELVLMDTDTHKVLKFDLLNQSIGADLRCEQYNLPANHPNPVALKKFQDKYLLMYANENIRFGLCDSDTLTICYSAYPDLSENKEICRQLWSYGVRTAVSDDARRLAVCTYIGASLEIFDISNLNELKTLGTSTLFPSICEFDTESQMIHPCDDTVYGFLDMAATNTHIFTLLEGKCEERCEDRNSEPNPSEHGSNCVVIFDWEGERVKTISLDRKVFRIALDQANNKIIALAKSSSNCFELLEFDYLFD